MPLVVTSLCLPPITLQALLGAAEGATDDANSTGSVWGTFSYKPQFFISGIDVLAKTAAGSAEDCALDCFDQPECVYWTWCPLAAGAAG